MNGPRATSALSPMGAGISYRPPKAQACTIHDNIRGADPEIIVQRYVNAERAIVRRSGAIQMWIVQVALKRPYTFIVLAFLIAIFGSLSAVRTPTDIFPSINIPVVSVVWTYSGLLPQDMSDRVIYYYERQLTSRSAPSSISSRSR
jgi:AcrB/AcrD/AcrF family